MPIHEFKCRNGHVTEKVFLTFAAVDELENYVDEDDYFNGNNVTGKFIRCPQCQEMAVMIDSVPLPAHFLGNPEGYHKPSPTKRHSYKHVNSYGNGDKPK